MFLGMFKICDLRCKIYNVVIYFILLLKHLLTYFGDKLFNSSNFLKLYLLLLIKDNIQASWKVKNKR